MFWYLIVATIPAALAGLLLDDVIENVVRGKVWIIAICLAVMGLLIFLGDKWASHHYKKEIKFEDIDVIAPTYGPGLVGALLVGVSYARGLAYALNKPLVGVNHLEGHIAANYITHPDLEPPFLCMLTSGGNTQIVYVKDYCDMEVLGKTRDDAIGEAFDKVARVIGLRISWRTKSRQYSKARRSKY